MIEEIVLLPTVASIHPRWFDLQTFARAEDEGRTEEPTQKKIGKARGKGQVAKSVEIGQALTLLFGFLLVWATSRSILGGQARYMRYVLGRLDALDVSQASVRLRYIEAGSVVLAAIVPLLLLVVVVQVVANVAQFGFVFSWEPLRPNLSKLLPNPSKLIGRLLPFGRAFFFNFAKSLFKVAVIGFLGWTVLSDSIPAFASMALMPPLASATGTLEIAVGIVLRASFILLLIAAADYLFQRHEWREGLMMRKEEVKDERKQAEGDPEVKRQQRRRMMETARRRMLREVPRADVVITNPTHYAVALKYESLTMRAPTVVAKGEGFLALRIRRLAEESDVPVVENKPLAQALYKTVEIGREVPAEFYGAIAEVLAYVYRRKRGGAYAPAGAPA